MAMTTDAKRALSKTIRALRERLLAELHESVESEYRLAVGAKDATLPEASRVRRARLEAWIDEQTRTLDAKDRKGAAERFRLEVEKDAAAALLQRLVFVRLLEASGLRSPKVVTGGWSSPGYRDNFRELARDLVRDDETEGYALLLQLVFDELAMDLPGLFGEIRLTGLVPVPAKTLRAVVEALDADELESCWTDDTTLGWIYQYWNDPEREALDAKIAARQKLENHEIASKTQMFTERYMVEWLLQNSLGPMWLAMCKKHGWTPEVESDGTLERLEARRVDWRAKRDAGEVELTELMPLETDAERRWAYYVPQPIPDDAVEHANDSVRDLKILDPAVGSGHFLVIAFDLLVALYREEARHRGEEGEDAWSDRAIVERIVEHNLHGIDIDPRAVQIAAAAVWLKAQQVCADAHPRTMNLVAPNLRLSSLPADDPARRELCTEVERETGIPEALTERLLEALAGADHLGSLLKLDVAVDEALAECEVELGRAEAEQGELFGDGWKEGRAGRQRQRRTAIDVEDAKATVLDRIERFLQAHGRGDDLGLKLRGQQLAAGVRFVRMLREGTYDLVVANPPYQGTSKMRDAKYVAKHYPLGKADLFAAFLLRGLELVRRGGVSAMLTMRNWMFIKQFAKLREELLDESTLRTLGDLSSGAFEEINPAQVVVTVTMSVFVDRNAPIESGVALKFFDEGNVTRQGETARKRAAAVCHAGRHEFDAAALRVVPEWPLVYWWSEEELTEYSELPKLGDAAVIRQGIATADDSRFLRQIWEVEPLRDLQPHPSSSTARVDGWVPYISGAPNISWIQETAQVINWGMLGAELAHFARSRYGRGANEYFRPGIAFSMIGNSFDVRLHRHPSIFGAKGSSVFTDDLDNTLCLLNSSRARRIVESLNPSVSFTSGDVARVPLFRLENTTAILQVLVSSFAERESHREPSPEFQCVGPSSWESAKSWAQSAVDTNGGMPAGHFEPDYVAAPPSSHLSFWLGVALGRFGAEGEGVLMRSDVRIPTALPHGLCFLDASTELDSLSLEAAQPLQRAWAQYGRAVVPTSDLRTWLRLNFFKDVHRGMYENRPIYFPLSSAKKTFVAFVSIHRWTDDTLRALLAEHLHPALARLEGEITDLRDARQDADKKVAREAERRYDQVMTWKLELDEFIATVEQCAEKGPPPPDNKTTPREVDARYVMDLDDGVMINSAALWPLLEPQWKDPKKWWKQLANAKGKKDYDWSHLAARYFPTRVDEKCRKDPSLGVAHGCFWKYHPEAAYRWELRLQDEIAPDFTIDEDGSDQYRAAFEAEHPDTVEQLVAKEHKRRAAKRKKEAKQKKQQQLDLDAADTKAADTNATGEDPRA